MAPAANHHRKPRDHGKGTGGSNAGTEYRTSPRTDFLAILHEDFGISMFALGRAFMGVPPEPKKEAIALCEWAIRTAGDDVDEASDALRAWATKNRRGQYDPRMYDPEPATFGGREARGV